MVGCTAGSMHGSGHAWWGVAVVHGRGCMAGGAWQGGVSGRRDGHCTAGGSTHPTGMHSC